MAKIVLSAGHDLKFFGASNSHYMLQEHSCALSICDLVMASFRNDPNVLFLNVDHRVRLFDSSDDSLVWKVQTINTLHESDPIDLVIELHFNACRSHQACGAETLYLSEIGAHYAWIFQPLLEGFDGKYDGRETQHRSTLHFLRGTAPPAIILEPLFIDNDRDARPLLSLGGRRDISDAIVEGIQKIQREIGQ